LPQKAIRATPLDSILDPPNHTDELAIDIINFVDEVMDKMDHIESEEASFHAEEITHFLEDYEVHEEKRSLILPHNLKVQEEILSAVLPQKAIQNDDQETSSLIHTFKFTAIENFNDPNPQGKEETLNQKILIHHSPNFSPAIETPNLFSTNISDNQLIIDEEPTKPLTFREQTTTDLLSSNESLIEAPFTKPTLNMKDNTLAAETPNQFSPPLQFNTLRNASLIYFQEPNTDDLSEVLLCSNVFPDEALTKEIIHEIDNTIWTEIIPDQFLPPLQISALHNEQLIFQQPFQEFKTENNSLELYNDQSVILTDNLASPELFNFLMPISQPTIDVSPSSEVEKNISKEIPARSYTFDEMVDFSYTNNTVNIQVNLLDVEETQVMVDSPVKDVKKFPEVSPSRRKVIRYPIQELFISFKQWGHYSKSHPYEKINYTINYKRTKKGSFGQKNRDYFEDKYLDDDLSDEEISVKMEAKERAQCSKKFIAAEAEDPTKAPTWAAMEVVLNSLIDEKV
jgi:hypothetical protein